MIDYHKDAGHELALVSSSSSENRLKQAEIYAYMARTEVLKDNKPKPKLETVWVLSMSNKGTNHEWKGLESFGNEMQAHTRLQGFVNHPQALEGTHFKVEPVSFMS